MTETILLIDDDPAFVEELTSFLEFHGVRCVSATDAGQAIPLLRQNRPQLLLLDQKLGPVNGIDVLRAVRAESTVACIILTGMQDPVDRIVGLELGADDYIHKTAMPREILARVRAVLRRVRSEEPAPVPEPAMTDEHGWGFRPNERELYMPSGARCHLTSAEFSLLSALHESHGQPISREVLTERVFARQYQVGDRAIDILVSKVRRKLEPDPDAPLVIKSVRQQGYVFVGFAATLRPEDLEVPPSATFDRTDYTRVDMRFRH
jgi:DNA-binding response OmpR family regulator